MYFYLSLRLLLRMAEAVEDGAEVSGTGKPGEAISVQHGESMKYALRTDFLFIGLGILPVVLALAGHPDVAILLFVPLLIAACLCGMHEAAHADRMEDEGSAASGGAGGPPPQLPAILMERRRTPRH